MAVKRVTVRFTRCVQDSQELGDDEHMVSRVFFDIESGGKVWSDLEVRVKQPVGASYEEGPLEVGGVVGEYHGPMSHADFRECVESYYRSLVGSSGHGIRIEGDASVRMQDNTFLIPGECAFDVESGTTPGGW